MRILLDVSALRQTRWYQLLVRFLLGGLIRAATGIIAKQYGPGVGGLFLAFPAIFPASATLIEKHQREKKERSGVPGAKRSRQLVAVDAAGTAIGSIGLLAFALFMAQMVTRHRAWIALSGATSVWMAVSVLFWYVRKRI